jgi:hypothetical protein
MQMSLSAIDDDVADRRLAMMAGKFREAVPQYGLQALRQADVNPVFAVQALQQ